MPSKIVSFVLLALVSTGCMEFLRDTQREKFLRLLKAYQDARAEREPRQPTSEETARLEALNQLRKSDPRRFELAARAVEDLVSPHVLERTRALVALGRAGECGRAVLEFRAAFFDPGTLSDFDARLLRFDDPAVFRLRRQALVGSEEEKRDAAHALDVYLPVKTDVFLQALQRAGWPPDASGRLEILAAGDRAVGVLQTWFLKTDPEAARQARLLLADIGTHKAARVLADAASRTRGFPRGPEPALEALARMDPTASVPALAGLLLSGKPALPLPTAWLLARRALHGHLPYLEALAASDDPALRLAGLAGSLRIQKENADGIRDDIRTLVGGKRPSIDPAPFLDFLADHPRLAGRFPAVLVARSRSPRTAVRAASASLLGFASDDASRKALEEALIDAEKEVRLRAVEGARHRLLASGSETLAEALRRRLEEDADPAVRAAAATTLGLIRDRSIVEPLLAMLASEETSDVHASLKTLGLFRDPDLLARIPLDLYWGPDVDARCAVVEALLMASDPDAEEALRALLALKDAKARRFGLSLTDPVLSARLLPALRDILTDRHSSLVADALVLLAQHEPHSPLTAPETYVSSPIPDVRAASVRILVYGEDPVPALLKSCESQDPATRRAAFETLASVADERAARRLEAGIFEADPTIRRFCMRALGEVGDESSLPYLVRGVSDPRRGVRKAATRSIASIGGKAAREILQGMLEDPALHVRAEAAAGLQGLGEEGPASALKQALTEKALSVRPLDRGRILSRLGDPVEAEKAFQEWLPLAPSPGRAWVETARAWGAAGAREQAMQAMARARDFGFDDFSSLLSDPAFRGLADAEGFAARVRALFRPRREGKGFLDRFQGTVRLHLRNGAHLDGRLKGFRGERFLLEVSSGVSEIPKGQVRRLEKRE